jgi:hypothetical protein
LVLVLVLFYFILPPNRRERMAHTQWRPWRTEGEGRTYVGFGFGFGFILFCRP